MMEIIKRVNLLVFELGGSISINHSSVPPLASTGGIFLFRCERLLQVAC